MKRNGRRSTASLAVVTPIRSVPERLAMPKHLSAGALQAWQEALASRPAGFFDEGSAPLLETYAVATAEHRRLSALVSSLDPLTETDLLSKLTRLMDTHALRIGAAATKLRLSNQSRYDAQRASTLAQGKAGSAERIRANYARSQ